MAVAYGDLIRNVERNLLNRDDLRQDVKDWINASQRRIARRFPWVYLEAEWTAPATSDAPNYYQWPRNLMAPLSLRLRKPDGTVGAPLVSRVIHDIDKVRPDQTLKDVPDTVTFTGKNMLLTKGFTSPTGYLLVLRGLQTPPALSLDTDVSIFPETFAEVIEYGATAMGVDWLWHDVGRTRTWESRFESGIGELRQLEAGDLDHQDQMLLTAGMADLIVDAGAAGGSLSEED